jgi:CheY-like chemotaxis protein
MSQASQSVAILLVDDDADCRMLLRDAITAQCPNPVFEVSSGEEALCFLRRQGIWADAPQPGLVFLDIEMAGMNGLETLRQIRAQQHLASMAVVMMTGVSDDAHKIAAMKLGANSYTNKPTDPRRFLQTIACSTEYWLKVHQYPDATHANSAA